MGYREERLVESGAARERGHRGVGAAPASRFGVRDRTLRRSQFALRSRKCRLQ